MFGSKDFMVLPTTLDLHYNHQPSILKIQSQDLYF